MTSTESSFVADSTVLDWSAISAARTGLYPRYGKRLFDIAVSAAAIIALAPFMAVVMLFARRCIGSPVFYRQIRLGLRGEEFVMLKFRSMQPCRRNREQPLDHEDRRGTHKSVNDPRHTRFGRLIRKSSIDELPQLLNVLKGEMSLVGPRPELPEIAARHNLIDHVRHSVRPGLTGLWQISNDRPGFVHENVRYDVQYAGDISFRTDLRIILKTIPVLVRCGGL